MRSHFFVEELFGGLRDRAMLGREIFGRENFFRRARFEQKRSALGLRSELRRSWLP